jgi:flagellum-specific peptidoglycan hydrolase FlgJ
MAHSSERTGYSLSADLFKDDVLTQLDQKIADLVDQFSDDAIFGAIEDRLIFAVGVASLREEIKRTCSNQLEATHLVRTLHGTVAQKIGEATERAIAEQRVTEATFESLRALPVPVSALQPHIYRFYDKAVKAQSEAARETHPAEKVARMNEAEDITMVAVSLGRDIPEERKGGRVVERIGVEVHAKWVLQARKDVKESNSKEKLDGVRGVLVTAYGHDLRQQPLAKDIGKVVAAVTITGLMTAAPVNAAHAGVRVEKQENLPSPQAHEEINDLSKPIKLTTVTKPAGKEVTKEAATDSPAPAEVVSAPIVVSLPEKTPAANEAKKETQASPVKEETPALEDGPIRISMPDVTAALPKKKAPATDAVTIGNPNVPKAAEAPTAEDDQTMITTLFPEGPLRISRSDIHIEHKPQDDTSNEMQISLPPSAELPVTPPSKIEVAPPKAETPVAATAPEQAHGPYQLSAEQNGLIDSLSLNPNQKDFLKQVTAGAIGLQQRGAKVNPEVVVAQSILESGWGGSELTKLANNYFGMKAGTDWKGKTVVMPTKEFINGSWVTVDARWQAFESAEDCFAEYEKFINERPYFADALQHTNNPQAYVEALVNGDLKYATDPDYVQKIMGTVKANHLSQLVEMANKAQANAAAQAAEAKKAEEAKAAAPAAANNAVTASQRETRVEDFTGWHHPVPVSSPESPQYAGHRGIDYAVPAGTPFYAAVGGVVKVLEYNVKDEQFCKDAFNNIGASMDLIKDPIQKEVHITRTIGKDTYEVIYAHMSRIDVVDGQIVKGNDQIGKTGNSGCSTGDHAHFEIRVNGVPINPDVLFIHGKIQPMGAVKPASIEVATDQPEHSDGASPVDELDGESKLTDEQKRKLAAIKQVAEMKKKLAGATQETIQPITTDGYLSVR